MRSLVLTGPPAAGKSTLARLLAQGRPRAACIEADDVRQLIVGGNAAPWRGAEGARQWRLSVANCCSLARNFTDSGFDVAIADLLTNETAALYRQHLPDVLVVELVVDYDEALRRAHTRPVYLTWEEFRMLHDRNKSFSAAEARVEITGLSVEDSVAAIRDLWVPS